MGNCKDNNCTKADCDCEDIERVDTVYAGVFMVDIGGVKAETILVGTDPETYQMRATVEHHLNAVPDLIRMCDGVEKEKGWPFRLLKFSEDGIEELDPRLYRGESLDPYTWKASFH